MALLSVDDDAVVAVIHRISHGSIGIELRPLLIKVGNLETATLTNGAGIGREVADQQSQQRCFPGTVRANQTDAVAAQYPLRVVANDDPLAKRFADALGLAPEPAALRAPL